MNIDITLETELCKSLDFEYLWYKSEMRVLFIYIEPVEMSINTNKAQNTCRQFNKTEKPKIEPA
jgi:hypothetical protein